MDLEAPHDEVLAQKDQANTVFLLHSYGLVEETKTTWEVVLGICRGGKGPQGRARMRERVTRRGEAALIKTSEHSIQSNCSYKNNRISSQVTAFINRAFLHSSFNLHPFTPPAAPAAR